MVYGSDTLRYTTYFEQAEKGKVVVQGNGSNILANVHVDDVADAYVRIVEADPHVVTGQIFLLAEDRKASVLEVAQAFALAAGFKGKIETGQPWFIPIFDTNLLVDSSKAKRVLGWNPSRKDITVEAPILYKSWKASGLPATF
eukprot:TRINITY_DN1026_c0_g1_i1.p1 TRINITY_DN1026_c0_g1~~TRINITY_DN1026_c0_g1_i1.p1  ORF type:complete len:143 (+),score=33.28 TRINITY_DN1026_c0_g1_i1:1085-1513(+)